MEASASASRSRPAARRWPAILGGLAAAAAVALIASACSSVAVRSMADPQADFATYATFRILPQGGAKLPANLPAKRLRVLKDPLYHSYIHDAITAALAEKGLRRASGEQPADLVVAYQTLMRSRTEVMPAVYGVGWRGHVFVRHPARVKKYKEGTLIIDLVDAADRHLVWRGVGVGAMRDMRPGDQVYQAVEKVLAEFPPEP